MQNFQKQLFHRIPPVAASDPRSFEMTTFQSNNFTVEQFCKKGIPCNIYLFKVSNRNTRKSCEICSKLTLKTPERRPCIMHNVWKWSGTLWKSCNICCKIFKVCLTISKNYASKNYDCSSYLRTYELLNFFPWFCLFKKIPV